MPMPVSKKGHILKYQMLAGLDLVYGVPADQNKGSFCSEQSAQRAWSVSDDGG